MLDIRDLRRGIDANRDQAGLPTDAALSRLQPRNRRACGGYPWTAGMLASKLKPLGQIQ